MTKPKVNTADVMAALRKKYSGADERMWAGGLYLEETGINGSGAQSRCDALYAGFTSDSGRTLIGHEVKVSRSDWLAELKKQGKADFWHDNCHQWYIVAPAEVVMEAELPESWGLMLFQGSRLVIKKRSPVRQLTPSWTAVRSMLSRAETLRAQSVLNAQRQASDQTHQQMRELQTRLQAAEMSAGGTSELQRQIREIVTEVRGQHYGAIDVERIVAAVLDVQSLIEASRQLRATLERSIEDANRVGITVRNSYGPLRQILEGMSDATA